MVSKHQKWIRLCSSWEWFSSIRPTCSTTWLACIMLQSPHLQVSGIKSCNQQPGWYICPACSVIDCLILARMAEHRVMAWPGAAADLGQAWLTFATLFRMTPSQFRESVGLQLPQPPSSQLAWVCSCGLSKAEKGKFQGC